MPTNPPREFEVKRVFRFEKDLKHILKTYPDFNQNIPALSESLKKNPEQGESLGAGVYKVRVEIKGKPAGDRYGARVIHAIFSVVNKVYLLRVYDKSDMNDLSPSETKEVIRFVKALRKELSAAKKKAKDDEPSKEG
jgi:hypothetical protein